MSISLISDVRNQFMRDTTGTVYLGSQKYRDGARKPTGNIALTDFVGKAWAQGRDIKKTGGGGSAAADVRPYSWDQRADNMTHGDATWTLIDNGGLPAWRSHHPGVRANPRATYHCSFFYFPANTTFRLTCRATTDAGTNRATCQANVYGYNSGYLSGYQVTYVKDLSIADGSVKTATFSNNGTHHYIMISVQCRCDQSSLAYDTAANYTLYDMRVDMV